MARDRRNFLEFEPDERNFLVIGRNRDGSAFLATRRVFPNAEAARNYAAGIAAGYRAEVVESLPLIIRRPNEDE